MNNTSFGVKPNLGGFTIAHRPQLPPPLFSRLDIRSFGFKDAFQGPKLRRQYHNIPFAEGLGETQPFSLICPGTTIMPVCERTPSKLSTYKILGNEMILLENYVSLKDQVDIVNMCEKWGTGPGGFYEPNYKEGEDYRIHTCFGRNWDPKTKYKNRFRRDGSEPPPIPYQIFSLAIYAIEDAQAHLNKLPSTSPDTCIVSFYPSLRGRIGLHEDFDESHTSLIRGLPVVSIFVGETAEFEYYLAYKDELQSVFLRSGDVLIYGGLYRLCFNGVTQILPHTMPQPLLQETGLKSGCLNLSLRQV